MDTARPAGAISLLQRARTGDHAAFEALIRPLVDPGYGLAFTMLGQRHDAEDAVQEAVLKAWTKLGQVRDGTTVRAWFLQVVANECRMSRRRRWSSVIKLPDLGRTPGPSEDQLAEATDLRNALAALTAADRLVLYLHYSLDLDLEETAAILRVTPAGAKSRLYRAISRLRPALEEQQRPVP